MEQVVVIKKSTVINEGYSRVYIGRPSALGNPYPLAQYGRAGCLEHYEAHLRTDCRAQGPMYQEIQTLALRVQAGECLALECYCAPLPCHGDLLKRAIQGYAAKL